jgi:putative spermidine/putrescine transport system ATP-binding protein
MDDVMSRFAQRAGVARAVHVSAAPGVALRGLTKRYGGFTALSDVSLDVRPGEFLTLLGPSGSGKTTLLMSIAGFVRPDAGAILVGGEDIVREPPHLRGIGMMFQSYALFPHFDVGQNIAYPLKLRGVPAVEIKQRVQKALALVQLDGLERRKVQELSGGQKQRVALARATVSGPRVLLMDEPLSALDKKLREQMQLELRRLHSELGMTTICVTHDQREALTLSDRVAVMRGGCIVQLGTPAELYEQPVNAFVADFVGDSILVPVRRDGARMYLEQRELYVREGAPEGANVLVIRPERLSVLREGDSLAPSLNVFSGVVADCVYEGESVLVRASCQGLTLSARQLLGGNGMQPLPRRGDIIRLALHQHDTIMVRDA